MDNEQHTQRAWRFRRYDISSVLPAATQIHIRSAYVET